jgi:hypothetical protein
MSEENVSSSSTPGMDTFLNNVYDVWNDMTDWFSSDDAILREIPENLMPPKNFTYASPEAAKVQNLAIEDAAKLNVNGETLNPPPVTVDQVTRVENSNLARDSWFESTMNSISDGISSLFTPDPPPTPPRSEGKGRIPVLSSVEDLVRRAGGDFTPSAVNPPVNTPVESVARLVGKSVNRNTVDDFADVMRALAFARAVFGSGGGLQAMQMHAVGDLSSGWFNTRDSANSFGFPYLKTIEPYALLMNFSAFKTINRMVDEAWRA